MKIGPRICIIRGYEQNYAFTSKYAKICVYSHSCKNMQNKMATFGFRNHETQRYLFFDRVGGCKKNIMHLHIFGCPTYQLKFRTRVTFIFITYLQVSLICVVILIFEKIFSKFCIQLFMKILSNFIFPRNFTNI